MIDLSAKMKLGDKILVLCRAGISRSVGLCWLLKTQYGKDAIPAGVGYNSPETIKHLYDWSDTTILVDGEMREHLPNDWKKLIVWDVGPDLYFKGFDEKLINRYVAFILTSGIEI